MKLRWMIGTALATGLVAASPAGAQSLFAPVQAGADVAGGAVGTGTGVATGAVDTGFGLATAPFQAIGVPFAGTGTESLRDFRAEALRSDAYEIEAGRLALAKSRDPRVRALARRTIVDHQRTTASLLPVGASLNATGDVVRDDKDSGSPFGLLIAPITVPVAFAGRLVGGQGIVDNEPSVPGRRVAIDPARQQQLETLASVGGRTFNATYAGQQVRSHRQAVALYSGYAQNGDDETGRLFAQEALPALQRHLIRSEQLSADYGQEAF